MSETKSVHRPTERSWPSGSVGIPHTNSLITCSTCSYQFLVTPCLSTCHRPTNAFALAQAVFEKSAHTRNHLDNKVPKWECVERTSGCRVSPMNVFSIYPDERPFASTKFRPRATGARGTVSKLAFVHEQGNFGGRSSKELLRCRLHWVGHEERARRRRRLPRCGSRGRKPTNQCHPNLHKGFCAAVLKLTFSWDCDEAVHSIHRRRFASDRSSLRCFCDAEQRHFTVWSKVFPRSTTLKEEWSRFVDACMLRVTGGSCASAIRETRICQSDKVWSPESAPR